MGQRWVWNYDYRTGGYDDDDDDYEDVNDDGNDWANACIEN